MFIAASLDNMEIFQYGEGETPEKAIDDFAEKQALRTRSWENRRALKDSNYTPETDSRWTENVGVIPYLEFENQILIEMSGHAQAYAKKWRHAQDIGIDCPLSFGTLDQLCKQFHKLSEDVGLRLFILFKMKDSEITWRILPSKGELR